MQAKENQEKPIKWFILPNEPYEWEFILEKQMVENPQHEVADETEGIKVLVDGIDVLPVKLGSHYLARSR
ncbi:MAG: hypothetical protein ACXV5H_02910 [Halobacteriota archaeon]